MKNSFADKLIPWMTLISGLSISSVAVWYSVAGLVAIFAASSTAIIIMGVVLEVGKLVTALWLHRHWERAVGWLKTYLAIAVVFLMLITSMGIFGFLSKAHIEQTSMSGEQQAQIEVIDEKITRSTAKIERWQGEIDRLLKTGGQSASMTSDQTALKELRELIQNEKDAIRKEANDRIEIAQTRRDTEIASAKPLLNSFGGTDDYNKAVEKAKAKEQKESASARYTQNKRLSAVDKQYAKELATLTAAINSGRKDTKANAVSVDKKVAELEKNIELEQDKIETVRVDKTVFEKEYRKLEAEVGPVKYIAEFIYGEQADQNMLEKAVTWVIIMIIFVFDPLAVLMLIASQYAFKWNDEDQQREGWHQEWVPDSEAWPPYEPDFPDIGEIKKQSGVDQDMEMTEHLFDTEEEFFAHGKEVAREFDKVADINSHAETVTVEEDLLDVPVLEGEEMWAQAAIDNNKFDPPPIRTKPAPAEDIEPINPVPKPVNINDTPNQVVIPDMSIGTERASNTGFGTQFPTGPQKGDMFLRVDYLPGRLYKWNGSTWIEIDKKQTEQFAYDQEYIKHLIKKIDSGEYDVELLSSTESEQIQRYLDDQSRTK